MSGTMPEGYDFYPGTGGAMAPCIYFVDLPEHPFDVGGATSGLNCSVAKFPVQHWDDALTPWQAPGLYAGDPDFKGQADATIDDVMGRVIPLIDSACGMAPVTRALAGYSLGGLFALYAFTRVPSLTAVASLSGSVWYDSWLDYLAKARFDGEGRFAFLSVGSKEKRANPPRLHTVEENTRSSAELLEGRGATVRLDLGPGSHIQHVDERLRMGLSQLDRWLWNLATRG